MLATATTPFTSYAAVGISVCSLGITLYTFRRRRLDDAKAYLANLWDSILDSALQFPPFFNANVTYHYDETMSEEERLAYDAFCYKAWGLIDAVVARRFHRDPQFSSIIRWTGAYHLRWMQLNPQFFVNKKFWKLIDAMQDDPQVLIRYQPLPTTSEGDIDWDAVNSDYHRYILGPFAPEMVQGDTPDKIHNKLLVDLVYETHFGPLVDIHIADFGCGPGNLIKHLPEGVGRLVGIDKSDTALKLACDVAIERKVPFESRKLDMRKLGAIGQFDIIICVNAISPSTREDVVAMLTGIRDSLRPSGRFLGILPAYDTTGYSRELWRDYYARNVDARHADRVVDALIKSKKVKDETSSYAEDGRTVQCYHTPLTIEREFAQVGLSIEKMAKIYYPWTLVRRFDYGYFPNAREEIWDWYVVARRA